MSEFLTAAEAADFLGLSKSTIYSWVAADRVPYHRLGRALRFRRKELERWLDGHAGSITGA
jgi:excisionase family DNA binding protein